MDIRIITAGQVPAGLLDGLAELLVDAVAGGASVGFLTGLREHEARDWWRTALQDPNAITWAALDGAGRVIGTVRLVSTSYPNGAHRAEVSKFLVRRDARGLGCGRALMAQLELTALEQKRSLLMLDTETGSLAESVYLGWGWQPYGVVDGHAARPDGVLAPTTFMIKRLGPLSLTPPDPLSL